MSAGSVMRYILCRKYSIFPQSSLEHTFTLNSRTRTKSSFSFLLRFYFFKSIFPYFFLEELNYVLFNNNTEECREKDEVNEENLLCFRNPFKNGTNPNKWFLKALSLQSIYTGVN